MGLIELLIQLVVVAVVIGVVVWAIRMLFPAAPVILVNGLYVLGVLIVVLILLRAFGVGDLGLPRVR